MGLKMEVAAPRIDQYVFLAGRPPIEEYLGFIQSQSVGGSALSRRALTEEWRSANDRVRTLESQERGIADTQHVAQVADGLRLQEARVLSDSAIQKSSALPISVGVVSLDNIVVHQKFINLRYVQELQATLGDNPTDEDIFQFCLPVSHPAPTVRVTQLPNGFVFTAPSSDLRLTDVTLLDGTNINGYTPFGPIAKVMSLIIGFGTNVLSVVRAEGRLVLLNGSHRAYALRDRGTLSSPCLVVDVSRREELPLTGLPAEMSNKPDPFLTAPRPPLLKDYFDPALRRLLARVRQERQVRIQFAHESLDVAGV